MDFNQAIEHLNCKLKEKSPDTLSSSWIYNNTPKVYRYIYKNIRLETGGIDWDTVTSKLDREYQQRWTRYRARIVKPYADQSEVTAVLQKYEGKLYALITQADDSDKQVRDWMIIRLVRLSQKGNVLAQEELIKWVKYVTDDWLDRYPQMYRWKGYEDEVPDRIKTCIRCYRYTGSFFGYLFKTLEYSAYGKPPMCSLDDKVFDSEKTRVEYAKVAENITG